MGLKFIHLINALSSFYRSQNVLCWSKFLVRTKTLFTFTKRRFAFSKIGFCAGTKCNQIFGMAQKLGRAQNILGPVKWQGISRSGLKHLYLWIAHSSANISMSASCCNNLLCWKVSQECHSRCNLRGFSHHFILSGIWPSTTLQMPRDIHKECSKQFK